MLVCVLIFIFDVSIENKIVKNDIEEFIQRGVFVGNVNEFYLYEVEIEEELVYPSINFDNLGNPISSNPGDIFVYRTSTLDENYPGIPFIAEFSTYFFGGHAGVIIDDTYTIETNGAYSENGANVVALCTNNIMYTEAQRDTLGLRVRATQEDTDTAINYLHNAVGTPYNYSFIFNRENSYYCTDLVARSFGFDAGLPYVLDKDGVATSCNDLIISDDTYITYYMYYVGNQKHLYYAI